MTASRHGDKQICSFSRVSFLSESPTPNGLPKHLFIMAYRTIGLRVDVYQCHISSYGKLDQMGKVRSFSKSNLPELPPRRSRSCSLAMRLSSSVIREATSVWVLSRVIRVACHPTWGHSGIRKEDSSQP